MTKMTIKEATQKWVSEFNAIPQSLIEKAYPYFDEVEHLATNKECVECGDNDIDDGVCANCESVEFGESYGLPMWGTMWTFGTSLDDDWALSNLETMRECGILVYQSDELGVFFGIDGAGYDFYESHWIPLYKKRGLHWHNNEC